MTAGKHDDSRHSATALPPMKATGVSPVADKQLSAAFERALGGGPAGPHLPASSRMTGQEIARHAKGGKPAPSMKGAPGKTHIGPRSGHK